jgi:hypothetical protein
MKFNISSQGKTDLFDIDNLPATKVHKGSKALGIILMAFASLWGGIPTVALIASIASGEMKPEMLFILIFTVAGTGLFLFGLSQFFRKKTTTIATDDVRVESHSLFGRKQWTERLSRYEGVLSRSEYHSGGKNSPSYTLYIVELHHTDPKKIIRLYASRSDDGFRRIWEDYCRKLDMNAVEKDGDELIRRNVEDLDKSVKELVSEGKLDIEFDPSKPPPKGLRLQVKEDILEITITRKGFSVIGMLIAFLIPAIFVYCGFFIHDCPILFGIVGLFFGIVILSALIWSLITRPQIRLSREQIHVLRLTPWGETQGRTLRTAEIEMVKTGRKQGQGMKAVLLTTDAGEESVGDGLPPDALDWLKNCIMTVIAS